MMHVPSPSTRSTCLPALPGFLTRPQLVTLWFPLPWEGHPSDPDSTRTPCVQLVAPLRGRLRILR
jgi:hypothetical protein